MTSLYKVCKTYVIYTHGTNIYPKATQKLHISYTKDTLKIHFLTIYVSDDIFFECLTIYIWSDMYLKCIFCVAYVYLCDKYLSHECILHTSYTLYINISASYLILSN